MFGGLAKKIKCQLLRKKHEDFYLSVVAIGLFAATVILMFTNYQLDFHSDSAAANILMREQLYSGKLFPETWNTSTGIFIFFYNILMIPLSVFIADQLMLRTVAVLIILIAFILLLRYLSVRLANSGFYLLALCFLFSGTSDAIVDMSFKEAAYLLSFLKDILYVVLVAKAINCQFNVENKGCLLGFFLFTLFLSLSGILSFAYHIIPLFCAVGLSFLVDHMKDTFETVKVILRRFVLFLAGWFLFAGIGYAGYLVLKQQTEFKASATITRYSEGIDLGEQFLDFLLRAIGYVPGVEVFSFQGIMNAVVIFVFLIMVVCCVLLFRRYSEQPFIIKLLMGYAVGIFAIYLYFNFTVHSVNIDQYRYFYKPLVFLYLLAAYYLYEYFWKKGFLCIIVTIAAVFVFCLPCTIKEIGTLDEYSQRKDAQMGIVDFLKERGLTHGYATFWNAGNNMVLSDFEIEIGSVLLDDVILPDEWLSSDRTYMPEFYEGKSFLMLTQEENAAYSDSSGMDLLGAPQEVLRYEDYMIYVYPYNISENDFWCEGRLELIEGLKVTDYEMRNSDGSISLSKGEVIFGPYISLPRGEYQIEVECSLLEDSLQLRVTQDLGERVLYQEKIDKERWCGSFVVDVLEDDFEVMFTTDEDVTVTSVKLTKIPEE